MMQDLIYFEMYQKIKEMIISPTHVLKLSRPTNIIVNKIVKKVQQFLYSLHKLNSFGVDQRI